MISTEKLDTTTSFDFTTSEVVRIQDIEEPKIKIVHVYSNPVVSDDIEKEDIPWWDFTRFFRSSSCTLGYSVTLFLCVNMM